jgi:hypothetical protein
MAGRRGVLGGLLGALGAAPSGAQPAMAVQVPVGALGSASALGVGGAPLSPEVVAKEKLLSRLLDDHWARRRSIEERLALTGGIPPGILACKSWKPWFQVRATLAWREEHLPEPRFFERVLYRQVFGRDPD